MTTINSAVNKQTISAKPDNSMRRALLIRRLNLLLAAMGRALNTSSMVSSK